MNVSAWITSLLLVCAQAPLPKTSTGMGRPTAEGFVGRNTV